MIKITDGLYYTDCNLDLSKLKSSCLEISKQIESLPKDHLSLDINAPDSTKSLNNYNVFSFAYSEIDNLYNQVKEAFDNVKKLEYGTNFKSKYYMRAWVNVYNYGKYLDWHGHHYNTTRAWHGFFCVDTMQSETIYEINANKFSVESVDNRLVIGISEHNRHRTTPWQCQERPRITIAFDIILQQSLKNIDPNKWISV